MIRSLFPHSLLAAGVSLALSGAASAEVALKRFADGFVAPTVFLSVPGKPNKFVVADQPGIAYTLDAEGKRESVPFLDLRSKLAKLNEGAFDERGLLGMAFHPKFPEDPRVFVHYSGPLREGAPEGWDHTAHLASFVVKEGVADLASEKVLLAVDEPQFNHNSGRMVFGMDGYLYLGLGDGGNGNDVGLGHVPGGNAQDIEQLLGKILRLDVDKGDPYGVPADNPFVGKPGRDEIFAWGIRNPWGVALDPDNAEQLIVSDVGQDRYEEVNLVRKGQNYGWNIREGFDGFDPEKPRQLAPVDRPKKDRFGNPLTDPVLVYKNYKFFRNDPEGRGISITGGVVYTGSALPELKGRYLFADWSQEWGIAKGVLFSTDRKGDQWKTEPLKAKGLVDGYVPGYVVAFGQDAAGEVYLLTAAQPGFGSDKGAVLKLVPAE